MRQSQRAPLMCRKQSRAPKSLNESNSFLRCLQRLVPQVGYRPFLDPSPNVETSSRFSVLLITGHASFRGVQCSAAVGPRRPHLDEIVDVAHVVRPRQGAVRIVRPVAVHNEFVLVPPRLQKRRACVKTCPLEPPHFVCDVQ